MNENFITLKTAVNNYAAEVNGLKEIREKALNKTQNQFKGEYLAEQIRQCEESYTEGVSSAKDKLFKVVNNICDSLTDYVQSTVSKSIPDNIVTDLDSLRKLNNLSESEIKLYADKCKDCYLALRIISEISSEHGYSFDVPTLDTLLFKVENIRKTIVSVAEAVSIVNPEPAVTIGIIRMLTPNTTLGLDGILKDFEDSFDIPTVQPRVLTELENNTVEQLCSGKTEDELMEIYNSSFEIGQLILAHPKYSKVINESRGKQE